MREDDVMRATDIGMVPLGYGRFVRADDIVAVLPIEEGRGRGRRTHVHVAGLVVPIVASRSEGAILADMKTAARADTGRAQMSVDRHGPSQPQVPRLIAEVASASVPAGPERDALALRCRRRRQRPLRCRKCTRLAVTTDETSRGKPPLRYPRRS